MPNQIVFVQGSPRKKGNTRAVAAIAMNAAQEAGASVTEIDATKLQFEHPGCIGCQKCQESEKFECSIDDEVGRTVATIPQYDVVVMATPLYWWSYSAQLKIFIDRMYSLSKFTDTWEVRSMLSGKTFALMATAGGPIENNLELLERQWKNPADMLGSQFLSCLFPLVPPEPGALVKDAETAEKARNFGRSIAG
jgi:multimeric flavodoxin WrbA